MAYGGGVLALSGAGDDLDMSSGSEQLAASDGGGGGEHSMDAVLGRALAVVAHQCSVMATTPSTADAPVTFFAADLSGIRSPVSGAAPCVG